MGLFSCNDMKFFGEGNPWQGPIGITSQAVSGISPIVVTKRNSFLNYDLQRNEAWTRSLAVGSEEFVLKTQSLLGVLGVRGKSRAIIASGDCCVLREFEEGYGEDLGGDFTAENQPKGEENRYFWA